VTDLAPLAAGARVLVTGAGITGRSVSAVLEPMGVRLTICDDDPKALQRLITPASVVTTDDAVAHIGDYALVVTSPGFAPTTPVLAAAAAGGVPIWGDVELAWRLDRAGRFGPPRRWLVVTGTNGKTTTTSMLHAMLVAAGMRAVLCGNIGNPVLDVLAEPADLLAVELSSFQLHWAPSLRPEAGVVLNVAEDHLDWHGSMRAYAQDKARVLDGRVAVAGLDDPVAARLLQTAASPVRVGFRLGEPHNGELGVRDGMLVDNAFANDVALAPTAIIPVAGPVGVLDALAAAALARAVGAPPDAIAEALSAFEVGRHRAEMVAEIDGVTYVDDSKATNPHAAQASISAYRRVVWIAGGLLKGASIDEMVIAVANRLVGAVVIGRDRALVREALSRHAPDVPVVEVVTGEDSGVLGNSESSVNSVTRVIDRGEDSIGDAVMSSVVGRGVLRPVQRVRPSRRRVRLGRPRRDPVGPVSNILTRLRHRRTNADTEVPAGEAAPEARGPRTRFGAWLGRPMTSFHLIIAVTALLITLGLTMVLSASGVHSYDEDGSPWAIFGRQVLWTVIGLFAFYIAMRMPVQIMRSLAFTGFAVTIVMLVLVLIPGIGKEANGSRGWFVIAGFSMQPSELAKIAFAIWGAHLLAARRMERASLREMLIPLVPAAVVALALIVAQPDLGQTVSLGIILLGLLWYAGLPLRVFVSSLCAVMASAAVLAVSEGYRSDRVQSWLNPNADAQGSGYQARQAKFALANGGVFGDGLGQGTAKWNYLPNAHNDFIFAIIGEELGFVGAVGLLLLFGLFAYTGMRIARRSADPFLRLLTATATLWVMGQVFINVGYVVGLLPVTGLQLPLISAGGTSTATTLLIVGIMANAARHEPEAVAALRAGSDDRVNRVLRLPLPSPYVPTRTEALRDRLRSKPAKRTAGKPAPKPVKEQRRKPHPAERPVRRSRHHGSARDDRGRRARTLEGQRYG
jgi:cell division protein FtsW